MNEFTAFMNAKLVLYQSLQELCKVIQTRFRPIKSLELEKRVFVEKYQVVAKNSNFRKLKLLVAKQYFIDLLNNVNNSFTEFFEQARVSLFQSLRFLDIMHS